MAHWGLKRRFIEGDVALVTSHEKHNEFVREMVTHVGGRMLAEGTFSEQMVMLESLVAGLFAATIVLADKQHHADEYLSALTHGVRGRLPALLTRETK